MKQLKAIGKINKIGVVVVRISTFIRLHRLDRE